MFADLMTNKYSSSIDLESVAVDTPVSLIFDGNVNTNTDPVKSTSDGVITFNERGLYRIAAFLFINAKTTLISSGLTMVCARAIYNGVGQPPRPLIRLTVPLLSDDVTGKECWLSDTIFPTEKIYNSGDTLKYEVWTDGAFSNDAIIQAQSVQYNGTGAVASYFVKVYRQYTEFQD